MEKYITMLMSDDHLLGVLALNNRLKKVKSTKELVCLISNKLSDKTLSTLTEEKIRTICRLPIELPKKTIRRYEKTNPDLLKTINKIYIFSIPDFSHFVYLDSDVFVLKNIDDLFEKNNFSAVPNSFHSLVDKDMTNPPLLSLLSFTPHPKHTRQLLGSIENLSETTDEINEKVLLKKHLPNWIREENLHLPFEYCIQFSELPYISDIGLHFYDIKTVHFNTKKPWYWEREELNNYILKGYPYSKICLEFFQEIEFYKNRYKL